jgi:3-oxoacyl-[acyl-carrier protein] reductase
MTDRMQGKTAVITGAGSGMGRAAALLLAREGAQVVAADIAHSAAEATAEEIRETGGEARAHSVDISSSDSVDALVRSVEEAFGTITTLVNCAGIFDGNAQMHETDEALWDRIMAVDLKGIYLMSRAFLPLLQASGNASIVNLSSVAGIVAGGGGFPYTVAKHGVLGITKAIASDYGPVVRCNAVLPGSVLTNMTKDLFGGDGDFGDAFEATPAGRFAQPGELANAILFLASDESSFMYGSQVVVDGGWTVR